MNYDFIKNKEINYIKKVPYLKIIEEELNDTESEDVEDSKKNKNQSIKKEIFNKEEKMKTIQKDNEENKNDIIN